MPKANLHSALLLALTLAGPVDAASPGGESASKPLAEAPEQTGPLDLAVPADNLTALVKMRCSLDPKESVVTWWKGTIFVQLPEKAPAAVLGFEGFNVCRTVPQDDGTWQFLSRELSFYRDLKSGEIIDRFANPWTGATNEVIHVANDPVSHIFSSRTRAGGPNIYPWKSIGGDLMLTFNVPLTYPNPLQPDAFPEESSGKMYTGSEHFMFFTPKAPIDDPSIKNAPASYGWTRIGPYLPWMKMGRRPGNLLYIAQGHKLGGIDELPDDIRARIDRDYPDFRTAPETWYQPNATSWTYYKALIEKRRAEPGNETAKRAD